MVLSWLALAKRPVKFHEIQAMKSINIKQRNIDIERRGFQVGLKDLCGSLIDVGTDGVVDFVHLTAKR